MPFDVDVEVLNGNHVARKANCRNQYKHGKDTTSAANVEVFNYLLVVDKEVEVV
tara:strand:- start:453 stop:614 length:162 start_codon:yes stop_codon:yes gene_type:complete